MYNQINYREDATVSRQYKEEYLQGIERVIVDREKQANMLRDEYCKDIFVNQEKYREDFKRMLGWPLTEKKVSTIPMAKIEKLYDDENCSIYRISIDVMDRVSITGLLFKKDDEKRPLVIAQHGGLGTPELVGNLYGDTANYNHMIERILNYDVHVFAPQLLLWSAENYGVSFDRVALDARLKRVGSSISALEIYGLTKVLDYFEAQDYVGNFGMVGLSYGGFYTLFTTAVDTRIKSAVSCSFFNKRSEHAWCDWTWFRSAETFSDAEVACLIYPRKLCIEVGINDEIFDVESARDEMERLEKLSDKLDEKWLHFLVFEGVHEFSMEDEPLKRLAADIL